VFRRLMAHSAALRAESVAVTGHRGQSNRECCGRRALDG
jgi:hypothetical protein